MIYYSSACGGFYFEDRGDYIPENSIIISQNEYDNLIAEHLKGKLIVSDEMGRPMLKELPPSSQPTKNDLITEFNNGLARLEVLSNLIKSKE
jgi:hypothetical protein